MTAFLYHEKCSVFLAVSSGLLPVNNHPVLFACIAKMSSVCMGFVFQLKVCGTIFLTPANHITPIEMLFYLCNMLIQGLHQFDYVFCTVIACFALTSC